MSAFHGVCEGVSSRILKKVIAKYEKAILLPDPFGGGAILMML